MLSPFPFLPSPSRLTRSIRILLLLLVNSLQANEWNPISIPPDEPSPLAESAPATLWYRSYIQVPANMVVPAEKDLWRDSMMLGLSDVAGPFQVFLNGTPIIGQDHALPPSEQRRFKIPKGILQKDVFNCLIIRLQDGAAQKGLITPPVYFGYHHELRLDRPWQVNATAPSEADHSPLPDPPDVASYTSDQFRRASTVLDPTRQPSPGKRVPPAEALALLVPADDLQVEALLHEPQVAQPTHFSFDARGRLWVAQYRQYPFPAGLRMISRDMYYRSKYDRVPPAPPNHDRGADVISVHEDADGDGVYESHRRVLEGLNMANAVVHGHGGIWVMQTPYLLFYPDADGDDLPDGDPQVCLAGFGLEDTHSVANGLAWGPDGWLYGAQGSTTTSRVTRPGVDPENAAGLYNEGCMVWRYHPRTKAYEIFADGSGNTFGLAFDAEGRLFSGHNGGDTRGWHHIQEGLYLKQGKDPGKFGPSPNPYAFGELSMMASAHPVPRFSHMLIHADGPALPESLRGHFLAIDPLHHHAIIVERLPQGSTFSTRDLGLALQTQDETFRPVYLANGPDGAVTLADFREEYIAHGQNYQGQIDTESGRLYRLRAKNRPLIRERDLSGKSSAALVDLLNHPNTWHRQTAVRLLGERRDPATVPSLERLLIRPQTHPALEALWALHQQDQLRPEIAERALRHPAAMVRAWAIRLLGDAKELAPPILQACLQLAASEPDAEVRVQLLGTARRLPPSQALGLVQVLAKRQEDVQDPFIPLMAWFTLESHCATHPDAILNVFLKDEELWSSPLSREHLLPRLIRRFAAEGTRSGYLNAARLLQRAPDDETRGLLLAGFEEAFAGRALPPLPDELQDALARAGKGSLAFQVRGAQPDALERGLTVLGNTEEDPVERAALASAFGALRHPEARQPLITLALSQEPEILRRAAFAALQRYDDEDLGSRVTTAYPTLPAEIQEAALTLLVSRSSWARMLLQNPEFPSAHLNADVLARLQLHRDQEITRLLEERLPGTRPTEPPPLASRIADFQEVLRQEPGDPYQGEPLFQALCAACHRLFHRGGEIGPDLTSYQREDLSTLLPSLLAPSLEIREGYENHLVTTTDGRILSGFLTDRSAHGITLRGLDGTDHHLAHKEIAQMEAAGRSLMPDGLLDGLSPQELRDFFAYLRIPQPISP